MDWFEVKKLWAKLLKSRKKMATHVGKKYATHAYKMEANTFLIKVTKATAGANRPAVAFKLRYHDTNIITWFRTGIIRYDVSVRTLSTAKRLAKYSPDKFTFGRRRFNLNGSIVYGNFRDRHPFEIPSDFVYEEFKEIATKCLNGDKAGLKEFREHIEANESRHDPVGEDIQELIDGPPCGRQMMLMRYIVARHHEYEGTARNTRRLKEVLAV